MAAAELVAVMVLPVLVDAQMACAGGFERAGSSKGKLADFGDGDGFLDPGSRDHLRRASARRTPSAA